MRRREFITLLGSAAATWPIATRAQQHSIPVVGFLGALSASSWATRVEALRAGLRDLGYVEGKNIVIEFRWAEGNYDRLVDLAGELVRWQCRPHNDLSEGIGSLSARCDRVRGQCGVGRASPADQHNPDRVHPGLRPGR